MRARLRAAREHHQAVELARGPAPQRLAEGARHHRHYRRRHPRADRANPREGHAECCDRARVRRRCRPRRAEARGCCLSTHGRARARQGRDLGPELWLGRDRVALGDLLWPPGNAALPCGRHRLWAEAQHPARARDGRLPADRSPGDGYGRGDSRAETRWRVPVQRPRRPGGDRRLCRAGDHKADRLRPAGIRHLPRPSDARPRTWRQDRQDASGSSRREPSGERLHHRQGRDHLDEPRLRRRPHKPASISRRDPRLAVRRLQCRAEAEGQAGVLGAVPPGSLARPARQPLPLSPLRRDDEGKEGHERRKLMPKRTDIKSILIIGAGPIVIGQACEFDYSGTQACKALKEEGYRVVLVNSNPATIMTDPDLADATYVEPITPEIVAKIIEQERPDALLPTMGGQTALNCALSLRRMGVLEKFGVTMIGATADAIDKAEDRALFREAMTKIGLETPRSKLANASELKKQDRDKYRAERARIAAIADESERQRQLSEF